MTRMGAARKRKEMAEKERELLERESMHADIERRIQSLLVNKEEHERGGQV